MKADSRWIRVRTARPSGTERKVLRTVLCLNLVELGVEERRGDDLSCFPGISGRLQETY